MGVLLNKMREAQAAAGVGAPPEITEGAGRTRGLLAEKLAAAGLLSENETRGEVLLNPFEQPTEWDYDADPEPPVYLVDRLIEVGTITVLSADTGAGKSWNAQALAMSVATGTPYLGRDVLQGTVLYIDEENPARIPQSRLRALGMTNADRSRLLYFNRKGITVGGAGTDSYLKEKIEQTGAALLVVDTLMAAGNVSEINSNDEVVKFYKALRRLTEDTGVTVLLLHHERKQQQGQRSGTGQSSMGARQIAGQADSHLTLQLKEKSTAERADGGTDFRTVLVLNDAKDRDGMTVVPGGERVVIESYKDSARRLVKAAVFSEGAARTDNDALVDGLLDQVIVALTAAAEQTLKRKALAVAVSRKPDDGTLAAALKLGVAEGKLAQPSYGHYALAADRGPDL